MIQLNTASSAKDYDCTSEVELRVDDTTTNFQNTTGRAIQPVIELEVTAVKTDYRFTSGAVVKFRLYISDDGLKSNGNKVVFNQGNTIAEYIEYTVGADFSPLIMLQFGDFVFGTSKYMFITVESDNVNDDDVQIGNLKIYDRTCATEYSSTGGLPRVDTKTVLDDTPSGDSDFQAACDLAIKALELDHLMSAACVSDDITTNVVDNSVIAKILAVGGDISDFTNSLHSLEGIINYLQSDEFARKIAKKIPR